MGLLGNLGLGSIFSAANSAFNAHLQRQNMEKEANLNKELWEYQQSNAHQLEVQDLKNAGLNPILSATNAHIGNMSGVSSGSVSDNGIGSSVTSALASLEIQKMKGEIEQQKVNIDKTKAETDAIESASRVELNNKQGELYSAETTYQKDENIRANALNDARIRQIEQDIINGKELNKAQIEELASRTASNMANAEQAHAAAGYFVSQADYYRKQGLISDQEYQNMVNEATDPRKLYLREFWERVIHPKTKADQLLHDSYVRGLENGIIFNFDNLNTGNDRSESINTLSNAVRTGKYVFTKGR